MRIYGKNLEIFTKRNIGVVWIAFVAYLYMGETVLYSGGFVHKHLPFFYSERMANYSYQLSRFLTAAYLK